MNERGLTLVELLAALAIAGMVALIITSVLITGKNASNRSATNQQLQQEANYIVEAIRKEYLKEESALVVLEVNGEGSSRKLYMNGSILSQGLIYSSPAFSANRMVIDPKKNYQFQLELSADNNLKYEIKTSFSKLK